MPEPTQNFENHRSVDYQLFLFAALALASLVLSILALAGFGAYLAYTGQLLLILVVIGVMLRMRGYGLIVQDRIIRLEMQVRLARLGLEEQARRLTLKQLIALRFASDGELPGLIEKVLSENTTDTDEIKKQVKDWQPDYQRI